LGDIEENENNRFEDEMNASRRGIIFSWLASHVGAVPDPMVAK
jgi:hypothetical protein